MSAHKRPEFHPLPIFLFGLISLCQLSKTLQFSKELADMSHIPWNLTSQEI